MKNHLTIPWKTEIKPNMMMMNNDDNDDGYNDDDDDRMLLKESYFHVAVKKYILL